MRYIVIALALFSFTGCYSYFEVQKSTGEYADRAEKKTRLKNSLKRMGYRIDSEDSDEIVTDWRTITLYTNNRPILALHLLAKNDQLGRRALTGEAYPKPVDPLKNFVMWRYVIKLEDGKTKVTSHCLQQHAVNLAIMLYWMPCYDEDARSVIASTTRFLASGRW